MNNDDPLVKLEKALENISGIDSLYFSDPREFRSLVKVLEILKVQITNANSVEIIDQLIQSLQFVNETIEKVVRLQDGGLNNSLDTMTDVVREYSKGQDEIQNLRKSLNETQKVLTAKKTGQTSLRELWLRKVELQESIRMVRDIEELKNLPHKIDRLMQQKKFYSSVCSLNGGINKMFGEDLYEVTGLTNIRQQIMEGKEKLLLSCVEELKSCIIGSELTLVLADSGSGTESEDLETDYRSETSANLLNQSKSPDDGKSVVSFSMTSNNGIDFQSPNGNMEESAWSLDLTEVDEVIEQAILDVTSAGHVFIRLLVKTVGVLQCEEDVERLVLENLPSRFREIHLKNCKRIFTSKLSTYLEKARFSTEDDEIFFHGKLLADYIFTLLETLFGVMQRLLYVSHLLFLSKNGNRRDTDIKVRIRKEILEYWDEIEDMIIQEVESHLQDPDILKITDQLNTVSVSKRNDDLVSMDDDQFTSDSQSLVFKPSSKHGSILFKKIVEYNVRSCVLIKNYKDDNAIYETRKILDVIQSFLEKELIPVIQSTVNQEMIEIQLNPSLFLPSNDIEGKSDTKKPCLAAEKACHVSENLFNYWDQLFQHRTMVALILERLLRGFSSSAWENLESVLFPIYPATLEFRKSSLRFLQKDQFYIAMKKSMFSGKTAFDEFAQISNLPNESLKSTFDDNSLNIQYLQELKTIWISKFWDLSSLNYPFETMQGSFDESLSIVLSSTAYGCDCILKKVLSQYNHTLRKADLAKISNQIQYSSTFKQSSNKTDSYSEARGTLFQSVQGGLQGIVKVSDDILIVLRAMMQMICFHHLSKLTTYLSNLETAMATGKSTNVIDFSMADNGPNSQQEDSYITDLNRSLMGFSESIQTCYPSIHLSVVFGPLFCLLPRLLTVSIIQASNNGKILGKAIRNQKQRYLRIVVLVQQIVSSLINVTAALDYETKRKLSDCATNEFERLRKIVSMIDIPCSELKVYLSTHPTDFEKDEAVFLCNASSDRANELSHGEVAKYVDQIYSNYKM